MPEAEFYQLKAKRLAQLVSQIKDPTARLDMLRTAVHFHTLSGYALRNGGQAKAIGENRDCQFGQKNLSPKVASRTIRVSPLPPKHS
jgi:hypothetical protein